MPTPILSIGSVRSARERSHHGSSHHGSGWPRSSPVSVRYPTDRPMRPPSSTNSHERDRGAHRVAMSMHAPYLARFDDGGGNPYEYVPELSRRARGIPVWATLRALGRSGVADLVDRLSLRARQLAEGIAAIPGARILNEVVFTPVAIAFEDDERTRAVTDAILADGEVWMSGSELHGRAVLRLSISNWQTNERDVSRAIEAVRRAWAVVDAARS